MKPDKQQAARSILQEVKQRWGDGALYTSPKATEVQRLSTRYAVLDTMLGGIPRGHITELIGGLTSGITTFALELASTAQAQAEPVVYLDLRYSFDPYYAADHALRADELIVVRPALVLSGMDILYQLVVENAAGLIIVNSTSDILNAPNGSQVLDGTLRKLAPALRKSACAVLFLTPASLQAHALGHYASLRLLFERQTWIEVTEDVIGYEILVTVVKNRLGRTGQMARITILLDGQAATREQAA